MKPILEAVVELHDGLEAAGVPHAFGGAFALLWCTGAPRTTADIDINVFLPPTSLDSVLAALPPTIVVSEPDREALVEDGQRRLFFEGVPVDLFLDTTGFHEGLHLRLQRHQLGDRNLPFLSCNDLAVFKSFFDRRKDWADMEEMLRAGRLDVAYVTGVLADYLGPDDRRIRALHDLRDEVAGEGATGSG